MSTDPVNVYEAKTQLSRLIDRAVAGEDVVTARAGRPMVRLVPVTAPSTPRRRPGSSRGRIHLAADFDELPAGVLDAFRGGRP